MRITAEGMLLFGEAVSLKLAANGEWERALIQPLDAGDPQARGRWLDSVGDDVAIEIAFETHAFVGLRLRPDERAIADQLVTALLLRLAPITSCTEPSKHQTPGLSQVIDAIDQIGQPRFSGMTAGRAEIGVLDRLASLGAVDIGRPPFENVADSLPRGDAGWAQLTSALPAPLMLEVTYGPAGDGWLAAPVSHEQRETGGSIWHVARPDTFDRVAASLAGLS